LIQPAYGIALAILGGREEAEDAVQEGAPAVRTSAGGNTHRSGSARCSDVANAVLPDEDGPAKRSMVGTRSSLLSALPPLGGYLIGTGPL
jgi:hypothetical protein